MMTKREQLIDQYEDAAFALVMDKIAVSEGEKYLRLNSQLKDDPTAEVPEIVRRRAERTIGKAFRKARTASGAKTFFNVVNKVAVFFLVISMVFATAFTASADFRASTYSFVMKVFDDHFEYGFENKLVKHNVTNPYTTFELGWVPDGYSFVEKASDSSSYRESYQDKEGNSLMIWLVELGVSGIDSIDNENATIYQETINGYNVTIFEKGYYYATVPIPESLQVLQIIATSHELSVNFINRIIEALVLD